MLQENPTPMDGKQFLYLHEDNVVGYISLVTPYGDIMGVLIRQEFRGKGFGIRLMKELVSLLSQEGYKTLRLGVCKRNYAALKAYSSAGFLIVGLSAVEGEWVMEWNA